MTNANIRRARRSDVPALLDIYNHYVANTHITFDCEPRTLAERTVWYSQFSESGRYQCFVAEEHGNVVGWASSSRFKDRAAYDTSVETTVYLSPPETGRGLGKRLYEALLAALALEDVHRAYGAIATPNPASIRLHERIGFEQVAGYREVGRKFGRFWDVAVYERAMGKRLARPGAP
ncbi:MAG TPA: GNAT family N-acetyltransferase [Rhizomicrobium sp.]|jgi:phosphinothricin acetyltransferase|nr:GNAT family N-acetyltransferase [Rhizomicrobium sp.]